MQNLTELQKLLKLMQNDKENSIKDINLLLNTQINVDCGIYSIIAQITTAILNKTI